MKNFLHKRAYGTSGFSLMELLIVIAIMATLIAISAVSYTTVNKRSKDTKRKNDMEQLKNALEMYRSENGSYPNTGSGSSTDASSLSTLLVSSYMPAIPSDPKSTQKYRYIATDESGGKYYGYCLSAILESENPADTCPPESGYNYGVKNP